MKIFNLGYPRIGTRRELKAALETYWAGRSSTEALLEAGRTLCKVRWDRQRELGVDSVPVGDFSFYDHVLDHAWLVGAVPTRFDLLLADHWMDRYFAMARGARGVEPLDVTKWFNTNYHYLVPELDRETKLRPRTEKLAFELDLCRGQPGAFHPVLLGPWTFVRSSRLSGLTPHEALERLTPVYLEILREIKRRGFQLAQIDEPSLVTETLRDDLRALRKCYDTLNGAGVGLRIATYYESPEPWLSEVSTLPVEGIHFDLACGGSTLPWLKTRAFPRDKTLSLGLVNGRNVWATPLLETRDALQEVVARHGVSRVALAPSCPLFHLPHDRTLEKQWDPEFASWIAFADQRIEELGYLKRALSGDKSIETLLKQRQASLAAKALSSRVHRPEVKQAVARLDGRALSRQSPYARRALRQRKALSLPSLPTSTIGSFPQTSEIRARRKEFRRGQISDEAYRRFLREEIEHVIRVQERIGLDVLVHGECERGDMVEYFGELLDGFAFSAQGWVQSYGSRCVKPPLIFGDVRRRAAGSVEWFKHAQSLTSRPVKAIVTGPVTLLQWSFAREDQSRDKTAFQLALALRDEVKDLEAAGARVIQIDEAAFREGLPLKRGLWNAYLRWAVDAFRLCTAGLADETQVQAHMCYSEFGDVLDAIGRLDADVLLVEAARSGNAAFETFRRAGYANAIGPGVYDVHVTSIPSEAECREKLERWLSIFSADRLWVVPDCGLKTRTFEEIEPALAAMVAAAHGLRTRDKANPVAQRTTLSP